MRATGQPLSPVWTLSMIAGDWPLTTSSPAASAIVPCSGAQSPIASPTPSPTSPHAPGLTAALRFPCRCQPLYPPGGFTAGESSGVSPRAVRSYTTLAAFARRPPPNIMAPWTRRQPLTGPSRKVALGPRLPNKRDGWLGSGTKGPLKPVLPRPIGRE